MSEGNKGIKKKGPTPIKHRLFRSLQIMSQALSRLI